MRGFKPPYPPEFRARVVELARAGRSLASLAKEFGVTDMSIRNWLRQADLDSGRRTDGLTTERVRRGAGKPVRAAATRSTLAQAMPKATARYDTSGLRALIGPRSLNDRSRS
jgi:transposase-like protein